MPHRPVVRSLIVAAACVSAVPAAHGIVYRNDMSDALSRGLANQDQFKATGKVNNTGGTGTLIAPNWVLTARHVTGGDATGTVAATFAVGGTTYAGKVYANVGNDLSLIYLPGAGVPASAAVPVAPGFFGNESGKLVWLVGYGRYETVANQAATQYDGLLRAGTNVVREYQNPYLLFDNANTSVTSSVYESSTGPGDSGGPMYQQVHNNWYVVGEVQGAGASGFTHTPTNPNKAFILDTIRTVSGNANFDFAAAAGPTSLTWDSDVTVDGHNNGAGVWDTQRTNFRSDATNFNYQYDNAAVNDVTFGVVGGNTPAGTVTIGATNVASGTLIAGGAGPVYAAAGVTAHNLTFNSVVAAGATSTYTIAASGTAALTLAATVAGDPKIAANVNATISAPIESIAATITKIGTGRLVLSGANAYSGTLQVNAGVLQATRTNALPGFATAGRVRVAGGAGLTVAFGGTGFTQSDVAALIASGAFQDGSTLGLNVAGGDATYAAPLSGNIGLNKEGAGTLTLTAPATYTGPTTFNAAVGYLGGTLALTGNGRLPDNTNIYLSSMSSGTLSVGAGVTQTLGEIRPDPSAGFVSNAGLTVTGPGTVVLSANDYGAGAATGYDFIGLAKLTNAAATRTQAIRFNSANAGSVRLASNTDFTYAATYVGFGNEGTFTNTYTTVYLGTTTALNTDLLQIGNYHADGTLAFSAANAANGFRLRGTAGGDSRAASVVVGLNTAGAQSQTGTLNTTLGTIDARIGSLTVGTYQPATGNATATGNLLMKAGALDANDITLAYAKAASAGGAGGTSVGLLRQTGGTVRVNTLTLGVVANASQTATTLNATYDLNGTTATLAAAAIAAGPNTANAANTAATRKLTFAAGRLTTPGVGQDLSISGLPGGGPAAAANKTLVVSLTGTGGADARRLTAPAGATIRTTDSVRIEGTAGLTIDGPGTVEFAGPDTYTGRTVVTAGTLRLRPAAFNPVLTLGGADIQGGRVVFANASASVAADIAALLDAGFDADFAAGRLFSSTASGVRGLGHTVDANNTVTVASVLYGDADLSGSVDFDDFVTLQSNFGQAATGFGRGDFDYDGVVDFDDFVRLQSNFGQSVTGARAAFTRDESAAVTAFGVTHAVPEPAAVGVVGAALLLAARRSRRTA